ncbi:hypothetical protein LJR007_003808 [Aminobacter sp. LjRoot7]
MRRPSGENLTSSVRPRRAIACSASFATTISNLARLSSMIVLGLGTAMFMDCWLEDAGD